MTKNQILRELKYYLDALQVARLANNMALKRNIVICMAVSDIIKEFNGTPAEEKKVSELISKLLKIHFK